MIDVLSHLQPNRPRTAERRCLHERETKRRRPRERSKVLARTVVFCVFTVDNLVVSKQSDETGTRHCRAKRFLDPGLATLPRRMESCKQEYDVRPVYRRPTREARRAAIHRVEHEYELF